MDKVIDKKIFRDYDIRGIYPTQINHKVFYLIGRALSTYLQVNKIAVGYDCRLSSKDLFSGLTKGIIDQGVDVVDLGLISTEIHYFASGYYQFPVNVIISASQNPAKYNGLKIVLKGVRPLHGNFGLPEIRELAISQKFPKVIKKGRISKKIIIDDWINHALSFIDYCCLQPLKVAIDAGNGMGGISWEKIKRKLKVRIIPLFFKPDGHFPHHLPDPIKRENTLDLINTIKEKRADLGLAIDGDADRLFVVDEKGKLLNGSLTTALLSEAMLEKYDKAPILYNAVCGKIVREVAEKFLVKAIRVRVGHSFIKDYMKKNKALFAGEHSGHFYFRDNYNAESSLIAGLIILEYLSKKRKPLSVLVKKYDKYFQSGEINYTISDKEKVIKKIAQTFADGKSDSIDGLSVFYSTWWFNLRPSKTEPYLRLNLEADNKEILTAKLKLLNDILLSLGGKKV